MTVSRISASQADALVLVGGTGDLAYRMLYPSLYFLDAEGFLGAGVKLISASRQQLSNDEFRTKVREAVVKRIAPTLVDEAIWDRFVARLSHAPCDATTEEGAAKLRDLLQGFGVQRTVFKLAISPSLFAAVCKSFKAVGLAAGSNAIVLEKPIGRDLASCKVINDAVTDAFSENRVFRIDHYLGKETVQNLIALRFANTILEPMWNNLAIDHVQITVAETEGVGDRWPYFDEYGAMRDMLQNHMLQMLCLVAMEPPASLDPDAVRDEKVKVLRSLRPITRAEAQTNTVRGQYTPGVVLGQSVTGYLEERGAPTNTETFVALRADIDNWRWAGVPFFLRTGKRLPERKTEIVIQFKALPHSIFGAASRGEIAANRLVIELQPQEDISLQVMNKVPGLTKEGMHLQSLPLSLSLSKAQGGRRRIAYEQLLLDAMNNNMTHFVRRDESEAAWAYVDGIAQAWSDIAMAPRPYTAGTWGPVGAFALTERFGRMWHE